MQSIFIHEQKKNKYDIYEIKRFSRIIVAWWVCACERALGRNCILWTSRWQQIPFLSESDSSVSWRWIFELLSDQGTRANGDVVVLIIICWGHKLNIEHKKWDFDLACVTDAVLFNVSRRDVSARVIHCVPRLDVCPCRRGRAGKIPLSDASRGNQWESPSGDVVNLQHFSSSHPFFFLSRCSFFVVFLNSPTVPCSSNQTVVHVPPRPAWASL